MLLPDTTRPVATAILVAHGSPSDPDTLEAKARAVAAAVDAQCPDFPVIAATLAKDGSLEAALECASWTDRIIVYPFFMSSGWFVAKELRRRVAEATSRAVEFTEPFGMDPRLPSLCIELARQAILARQWSPESATVVLAAHGSRSSRAPAAASQGLAQAMRGLGGVGHIRVGFVEEAPTIAEAAAGIGSAPAVCLPLFALTAGHVIDDIPTELGSVDFTGPILPPVGEDDAAPALIAASLRAFAATAPAIA
ncbi:MAG: CbiX/SirB N-terminal domain-containing protein [Hyphomicrobiaceae bacterium]|nr:CbiX/SirB N-terminal domain-containing protein [Hyphomicrobiaceae bacterium]